MKENIKKAETLAADLGEIVNSLAKKTDDLDLQRLFKQLDADMMDFRHKLSLASKIINSI